MAKRGAFTFVLHSHLPYARNAGMWPHGEEWIHEAIDAIIRAEWQDMFIWPLKEQAKEPEATINNVAAKKG